MMPPIIQDTREQTPFTFPAEFRVEVAGLATGDYSVKGLESFVCIERKSLEDLLGCIGGERERFERELDRMRGYEVKAVVCECCWGDLELGGWRSKITPKTAIGSVIGWIGWGIPFILAGGHQRGADIAARLLFTAARRKYREAREFAKYIEAATTVGSK
jgi:hypothetical protein